MGIQDQQERGAGKLGATGRFYRDLMMRLIGFGLVGFLLMAAWLVWSVEIFSFGPSEFPYAFHRALGLVLIAPAGWIAWFVAVNAVRRRCPEHPTVLSSGLVLGISLGLLLSALVVVAVALF